MVPLELQEEEHILLVLVVVHNLVVGHILAVACHSQEEAVRNQAEVVRSLVAVRTHNMDLAVDSQAEGGLEEGSHNDARVDPAAELQAEDGLEVVDSLDLVAVG
jgi:hypothetical protein